MTQKGAPRWAPLPNAGRVDWSSNGTEYAGLPKKRKNVAVQRLSHRPFERVHFEDENTVKPNRHAGLRHVWSCVREP